MLSLAAVSVAVQAYVGDLPLIAVYFSWTIGGLGIGLAMLHLTNWSIGFAGDGVRLVSAAVQTMRMLGGAAGAAIMGALLNAIGSDAAQLSTSITAIFLLSALIALSLAALRASRQNFRPRSGLRAGYPLEQVNEAVESSKAGAALRNVIVFSSTDQAAAGSSRLRSTRRRANSRVVNGNGARLLGRRPNSYGWW